MANKQRSEWVAEEALAALFSVPRESLRAQRASVPEDELRTEGNSVLWKKTAARRVALALGLPPAGLEDEAAPVDAGEVLSVVSKPMAKGWHFANPHIIQAEREDGERVFVRVVDSRKYLPVGKNGKPMTVRAVKAKAGNHWELLGREPRFPGQW